MPATEKITPYFFGYLRKTKKKKKGALVGNWNNQYPAA